MQLTPAASLRLPRRLPALLVLLACEFPPLSRIRYRFILPRAFRLVTMRSGHLHELRIKGTHRAPRSVRCVTSPNLCFSAFRS